MKLLVLLVALAVIASEGSVLKSSRANLINGSIINGDRLLYRTYVYRTRIANSVQTEDVVFRGNATTRITAIQAIEQGYTQYASARVISGGVGRNNVSIRFTSARGYGYYYLLDIWGR